jgi:ketosteroid isomerase-like protein
VLRVSIVTAAVALLGCARLGGAPRAGTDADAVRAAQVRRFEAMTRRDLAALDGMLADELTYVHSSGELETKAGLLATLRSERLAYDSIAPSDVVARVFGGTAVVTGRSRMQVRAAGQVRRFTIRYTDVYVRRDGRWQTVAWQSTVVPEG